MQTFNPPHALESAYHGWPAESPSGLIRDRVAVVFVGFANPGSRPGGRDPGLRSGSPLATKAKPSPQSLHLFHKPLQKMLLTARYRPRASPPPAFPGPRVSDPRRFAQDSVTRGSETLDPGKTHPSLRYRPRAVSAAPWPFAPPQGLSLSRNPFPSKPFHTRYRLCEPRPIPAFPSFPPDRNPRPPPASRHPVTFPQPQRP